MIKIGRDEPVASMDSSGKIIWAKHNEIQTVNVKSVPADFEVRDAGSGVMSRPCMTVLCAWHLPG